MPPGAYPQLAMNQQLAMNDYQQLAMNQRLDATMSRHPPGATSRWQIDMNTLAILEKFYARDRYLAPAIRRELASILNASEWQVQVWFQNRRQKERSLGHTIGPQKPEASQDRSLDYSDCRRLESCRSDRICSICRIVID